MCETLGHSSALRVSLDDSAVPEGRDCGADARIDWLELGPSFTVWVLLYLSDKMPFPPLVVCWARVYMWGCQSCCRACERRNLGCYRLKRKDQTKRTKTEEKALLKKKQQNHVMENPSLTPLVMNYFKNESIFSTFLFFFFYSDWTGNVTNWLLPLFNTAWTLLDKLSYNI